MRLDEDDFSFSLSKVSFDINDENTWTRTKTPVAKMFYQFISLLVKNSQIDVEEIELLKTKEYTKNLFNDCGYPALANHREDNRGNSKKIRYRSKTINYNGVDLYVSIEFFDSDRQAVVEWYKNHLS